jgi:hypothetical protein
MNARNNKSGGLTIYVPLDSVDVLMIEQVQRMQSERGIGGVITTQHMTLVAARVGLVAMLKHETELLRTQRDCGF